MGRIADRRLRRAGGHGLAVPPEAAAHVAAHLLSEPFRRWRAEALRGGPDQAACRMDLAPTPWPFPD